MGCTNSKIQRAGVEVLEPKSKSCMRTFFDSISNKNRPKRRPSSETDANHQTIEVEGNRNATAETTPPRMSAAGKTMSSSSLSTTQKQAAAATPEHSVTTTITGSPASTTSNHSNEKARDSMRLNERSTNQGFRETTPAVQEASENGFKGEKYDSKQDPKGTTSAPPEPSQKTPFQEWMQSVNGGGKTTLRQQFELAMDLYQQAYPNTDQQQTAEEVIRMVENTPIQDTNSIVSWTGIKVDWFLNVFCQSPFMKVLIDYGCEVWFIRKICVIEMVRQTLKVASMPQYQPSDIFSTGCSLIKYWNSKGDMEMELQPPPNGTFVENIHSVTSGWGLEGDQNITSKPTTFISYTGAYTIDHVVEVLANLDPQEYVWMDIFCVNQFAWTGKGRTPEMRQFRDTFMDDLQNQIQAIGNTALILEKWDNVMLTLGQMWVLWEIFNTAQAKVNLKVLLTPEQRDSFITNCLESTEEFDNIQASLATINANDAVTDDDIDRQFILERMKREDQNLVQVNTAILEKMRDWLAEEGLEYLSKTRGSGKQPSCLMLNNLGSLLQEQGRLDDAEPLNREALETSRQVLGDRHPDTLTSINNMGLLMQAQGRLDEAEPLLREAMETMLQVLGDRHPKTLTSISNMGTLLQAQGRLVESEQFFRETMVTRQQVLGGQHPDTLSSINNMGSLLHKQGRLGEAEPLYREALETRRQVLGDRHLDTLTSISNLGSLLKDQGRPDDAEPLYREALETMRQVLGNRHLDTLISINNMGSLLQKQGQLDEAEALFREALETQRQVLGNKHPDTVISISNMGSLQKDQGRMDEAETLYREAMVTMRQVQGDLHPDTLASILNMGLFLHNQGRLDEAETLYREALETLRQVLGDRHPNTLASISNMGSLLKDQGRLDEAEPLFLEALETRRQVLGDRHPDTLTSMSKMGSLLSEHGRLEEAEPLCREALEARRQVLGDLHPDTLTSISNMGSLLKDQGRLDEAEPFLREALESSRLVLGDLDPDTLTLMNNLGSLLKDQGNMPEAVRLYTKTLGINRRMLGRCHPKTLISAVNLADLLLEQPAKPLLYQARALLLFAVKVSLDTLGVDHWITQVCAEKAVMKGGFLKLENGKLEERTAPL